MKLFASVVALLSAASGGAVSLVSAQQECPSTTIQLGGSSTVDPLAQVWIEAYSKICNDTNLVLQEACGSSCGARRVCDQSSNSNEAPLDVGDMSRDWSQPDEATTLNGLNFNCAGSLRRVTQVNVATYGISIAVAKGGVAADCISILGGLTLDQLRWIYSGFSTEELLATGWDASALKNGDGDDRTRLWSELDPNCAAEEILISGPDTESGTYGYFGEVVFRGNGEDHPFDGRPQVDGTTVPYFNDVNDELLVEYLAANPAAISYFPFFYTVKHSDILTTAAIQNAAGEFVQPQADSIASGDYNPFSRKVSMNVLNEERVLSAMRGFFQFAFSDSGKALVEQIGYVPLQFHEYVVMLAALDAGEISLSDVECGSTPGSFSIAGSSAVHPVAQLWAEIYMAKCPNVKISVEARDNSFDGNGGNSDDATRVCDTSSGFSPVDIGYMSRDWKDDEGTTTNGYKYDCVGSDRSALKIEVAFDGLMLAVNRNGAAAACIEKLGGLTIDQLRWMYSSFDDSQLVQQGWDSTSVPNSDGNPDTHLWSELLDDYACPTTEIKISGVGVASRTYDYFIDIVLPGYKNDGEMFDNNRENGYVSVENDEVLAQYLVDNEDAIAYLGYSANLEVFAVPIQNSAGDFVEPTATSVEDGSYNPLSRSLYMNLLDVPSSLALTRPFLEFGLSDVGGKLVESTGYRPLPELTRIIMRTRAQTARGVSLASIQSTPCGSSGLTIEIAGSSTVFPVANLWGEVYGIGCDVDVDVAGGGSSAGADRICGGGDGAVDIGNMSREWRESEASRDGSVYSCLEHDTSRVAVQIPVAKDGLTVATRNNGVAKACIDTLGGLTLDHLRWIYSSYTAAQLAASGWDPASLPHSDGNDSTHLWSELSPSCSRTEIQIAGADSLSGTYEYFLETVLTDHENGEVFALGRPNFYVNSENDDELVDYIMANDSAISYFGYSYFFANRDTLFAAPIENGSGIMVVPDDVTIGDGSYEPLARQIYMNLYEDEASLEATVPLLKFGMSAEGRDLVRSTGYVPVSPAITSENLALVQAAQARAKENNSGSNGLSAGAIAGIVVAVVIVLGAIVVLVICRYKKASRQVETTSTDLEDQHSDAESMGTPTGRKSRKPWLPTGKETS